MVKKIFTLIVISLSFNLSLANNSGIELIQDRSMNILSNIIQFLFQVFMLIGSALFIFLGIKYITSQKNIVQLHQYLLYLIIGITLLITSFFIPNLIKNFIESSISNIFIIKNLL